MLSGIIDSFWTFGKWIPGGYSPTPSATSPGDTMQDIFGSTLAVGNKVKLIGTITALDPVNAHFSDVTFTPDYPQNPGLVPGLAGQPFPKDELVKSVKCHPLQLMKVGSWL